MKQQAAKGKIFYGWFIVAAGFLVIASCIGIVWNCNSLFIKPICAELGLSRQSVSVTQTIMSWAYMSVSLIFGWVCNKTDLRKVMMVAACVIGTAFFLFSKVQSLASLYVITAVVSICYSFLTVLPFSLIISNWFYERRGTAIGLAFMGSGVGGMFFTFLAGKCMAAFGWRTTYQILAVLLLVIVVPCVFLIVRLRPEDMGLTPYGTPEEPTAEQLNYHSQGVTCRQAAAKPLFWILCLGAMVMSACQNSISLNIPPHLTDIGYSIEFATNVLALTMGGLAVGKLVLGWLYDKIGVRWATLLACIEMALGLVGMNCARFSPMAAVLIVVGGGMGTAFGSVTYPILTQTFYGMKDYSLIYGITFAFNGFGGGIASPIINRMYDLTKTYVPSLTVMLILVLICTVTYAIILRKTPDWKKESAEKQQ